MRIKRSPNFEVELTYRETSDRMERLRRLWELLIALPDPEEAENKNKKNHEYQKAGNI